ncbi:MAG: asparagine synthase (glutamine-hydrolyzing) [Planctomycetes bacterium]|nr:asparagine synthase (glutamine-hydrolyzing) [Planctomycetota bacterium]
MCGISGVFHYGSGAPADAHALQRMATALLHRGPDDEGVHIDGSCGLAFRRLSIIDLEGGHQPLNSACGRWTIVFNGEIYNFRELRRRCEESGHVFRTLSDTEVILACYAQEGAECITRLRGMFALAIYDAREKTLFLARDRLGIKPLYVYDDGNTFAFASEIKALHAHGGLRFELDPIAVADYFALRYIPAPRSIWKNVRKLRPAHTLLVRPALVSQQHRYWQLRLQPDPSLKHDEAMEALRAKLDETVALHMLADVPLGAFLSGGIDSAAVVSAMARAGGKVTTCTVGSDVEQFDERSGAALIAARYGTEHHTEVVLPDALWCLDRLAWHFDEPFADSSAIPTLHVCAMARRHLTVALSGDGGDENFAGYERRYLFERREDEVRRMLPAWVRRGVLGPLAEVWPRGAWLPRPLRAKTTLCNIAADPATAFFNTMAPGLEQGHSPLLSASLMDAVRDYQPSNLFRELMNECPDADAVSRAQYVDFHTFLVDDVLTKVDRMSMAVSLEVRVPLLDHEFVELAARMPSDWKLNGRQGKDIFREALRERLPAETLRGRKRGFEVPLSRWFRSEARAELAERLFDSSTLAAQVIDLGVLKRMHRAHLRGSADHSTALFSALMFQLWAKRFHA